MAGKTGKIVSLEAIEEHLNRQDKEIAKSHVGILVSFGVALAFMAFSALLARSPGITIGGYAFLMILALAVLLIARWVVSRIAKG